MLNDICKEYIRRLGINDYDRPLNLSFLELLQTNHIHTFCHDTLDCYFKRPVSLDSEKIINKFLLEGRGGLCFELNGAFHYLLQQLGFHAELRSSHVYHVQKRPYDYSIDTHAVIVVNLEGEKRRRHSN